jgi:hypothetical protein
VGQWAVASMSNRCRGSVDVVGDLLPRIDKGILEYKTSEHPHDSVSIYPGSLLVSNGPNVARRNARAK